MTSVPFCVSFCVAGLVDVVTDNVLISSNVEVMEWNGISSTDIFVVSCTTSVWLFASVTTSVLIVLCKIV